MSQLPDDTTAQHQDHEFQLKQIYIKPKVGSRGKIPTLRMAIQEFQEKKFLSYLIKRFAQFKLKEERLQALDHQEQQYQKEQREHKILNINKQIIFHDEKYRQLNTKLKQFAIAEEQKQQSVEIKTRRSSSLHSIPQKQLLQNGLIDKMFLNQDKLQQQTEENKLSMKNLLREQYQAAKIKHYNEYAQKMYLERLNQSQREKDEMEVKRQVAMTYQQKQQRMQELLEQNKRITKEKSLQKLLDQEIDKRLDEYHANKLKQYEMRRQREHDLFEQKRSNSNLLTERQLKLLNDLKEKEITLGQQKQVNMDQNSLLLSDSNQPQIRKKQHQVIKQHRSKSTAGQYSEREEYRDYYQIDKKIHQAEIEQIEKENYERRLDMDKANLNLSQERLKVRETLAKEDAEWQDECNYKKQLNDQHMKVWYQREIGKRAHYKSSLVNYLVGQIDQI